MAITPDTSAETASLSNGDPVTLGYTCGSGAKILVLMIAGADNGARTGSPVTPTYNSLDMTQANSEQLGSGEGSAEIWYRLDPPTGSEYTISVPNTGGKSMRLFAASFNATGSIAIDQNNGYNTTEANPSLTVTTGYDGELVIDVLASGYKDIIDGNSHTLLFSHDEAAWNDACQYTIQSSAGEITLSYTQSSDDVAMVLASFREVSGTTYDERGKSQTLLVTGSKSDAATRSETGLSQTVLVAPAESDTQAMTESLSESLVVAQALSDDAIWDEGGLSQTLLIVQSENDAKFFDERGLVQTLLVVGAESDAQQMVETLSQSVLVVGAESDTQAMVETLSQTVLVAQAESDVAAFDDTGGVATLLVFQAENDTFIPGGGGPSSLHHLYDERRY